MAKAPKKQSKSGSKTKKPKMPTPTSKEGRKRSRPGKAPGCTLMKPSDVTEYLHLLKVKPDVAKEFGKMEKAMFHDFRRCLNTIEANRQTRGELISSDMRMQGQLDIAQGALIMAEDQRRVEERARKKAAKEAATADGDGDTTPPTDPPSTIDGEA